MKEMLMRKKLMIVEKIVLRTGAKHKYTEKTWEIRT